MKKSKYDIGFFLSDPAFVDWVKNPSEAKSHRWDQWLERHPDAREDLYAAKAIILGIDYRGPRETDGRKEEILHNILEGNSTIPEEKTGSRTLRRYTPILWGAAAALLLFLITTLVYNAGLFSGDKDQAEAMALVTKYNPKGQKMSFYLPDNTRVVLNAGSTLSYPSGFTGNKRTVNLKGEAYFDVQHDPEKQFVVRSGDICTRVHGTAFNVRTYAGEEMSIALERGVVSVDSESGSNTSFLLSPGEKLTVDPDFKRSEKSLFNAEEEFGWKEGILVFRDAGMDEFTNRIERWYDVKVTLKGLEGHSWEVSGSFKHQSLETILESLEFSSGISYDIRGGEVVIYKKKQKPD